MESNTTDYLKGYKDGYDKALEDVKELIYSEMNNVKDEIDKLTDTSTVQYTSDDNSDMSDVYNDILKSVYEE